MADGRREKFKDMMFHPTSTLQEQFTSMLLAFSRLLNFDLWTSDVSQAYLQSSERLERDIYIHTPVPEFEMNPSQCLLLLKSLYGI